MRRMLGIAAVLLGLVATTAPATAGQQHAAGTQPAAGTQAAAAAEPLPAGVTIAVTGTDGQLWSRSGGDTRWTALGGDLLGAPAVIDAAEADIVHYVAQGTNGRLYHRTDTRGWHPLAPAAAVCGQPAMDYGVQRTTLAVDVVVGCRGTNNALYRFQFPLADASPYVTQLTKLGGYLLDGPALDVSDFWDGDDRSEFFWVRGRDKVVDGGVENVYLWNDTDSWYGYGTVGYCDGRPGVASLGRVGFACSGGGQTQVRYQVWTPSGYVERQVAGAIKGAPALVGSEAGGALLVVQGTNGHVYHRTIAADGDPGPGWTRIEAGARGGVSASGTS